jgi:hypothetical protein
VAAAGVDAGLVTRSGPRPSAFALITTTAVIGLTLATAWIHLQLGGLLFLLNALGYATLAAALVVPMRILARDRWLVRLALLGFTGATIVGWAVMGPRYSTAYIAKAIEIAMVALLVAQLFRLDGGVRGVGSAAHRLAAGVLR